MEETASSSSSRLEEIRRKALGSGRRRNFCNPGAIEQRRSVFLPPLHQSAAFVFSLVSIAWSSLSTNTPSLHH
ncbi:hypothetical protein BJY04DRAFT_113061 [Aspergillus karnatakaensis]|uniref:uncharacterized protein n=1 Tax=Aspergillus karnatakaensis TaxID=1810916 RepID=UPI003CCDCCA3